MFCHWNFHLFCCWASPGWRVGVRGQAVLRICLRFSHDNFNFPSPTKKLHCSTIRMDCNFRFVDIHFIKNTFYCCSICDICQVMQKKISLKNVLARMTTGCFVELSKYFVIPSQVVLDWSWRHCPSWVLAPCHLLVSGPFFLPALLGNKCTLIPLHRWGNWGTE